MTGDQPHRVLLNAIGFWGPSRYWLLPHPCEFIVAWDSAERERVVDYLRTALVINKYLGTSYCRMTGHSDISVLGTGEGTDGVWVWPESLPYYVETFNVGIPADFVAHMRSRDFTHPVPLFASVAGPFVLEYSYAYWNRWCDQYSSNRLKSTLRRAIALATWFLPRENTVVHASPERHV